MYLYLAPTAVKTITLNLFSPYFQMTISWSTDFISVTHVYRALNKICIQTMKDYGADLQTAYSCC